jgi:hypothetical protein
MSLLDWDYEEIAHRVQRGLDRLSVSFFRRHGARILRDTVDFHGYEHLELEVAHGGHRLHIRQYAPARGLDGTPAAASPAVAEEFTSTFDGRPAAEVPVKELARWLATLPVGEAPPEPATTAPDPHNPFAAARDLPERAAEPPLPPERNPFLRERPRQPTPNPFAPPAPEERRRRALDWLRGEDA